MSDEIAKAVFELVEDYNGCWFFLRKRFPLTEETDLYKEFKMAPEDMAELLEKYAEKFDINPGEINFGRYYPHDFGKADAPLTIRLLIESARAGRWLDA